jgi:hypothetical protein
VCPTTTWQSLAPLASAIAGSQTASTCVPPKPAAGSCHGGNYRVVAGGALASGALATPHGTRMLRGNGRIGRAPHTREVLVMVGRSRAPGRTSRGFISALPLSGHSRRATPPLPRAPAPRGGAATRSHARACGEGQSRHARVEPPAPTFSASRAWRAHGWWWWSPESGEMLAPDRLISATHAYACSEQHHALHRTVPGRVPAGSGKCR